jgi:hypothetical protein
MRTCTEKPMGSHVNVLEKQEEASHKKSRRKEVMKIRPEINEMETNRKT